jgi:hypothetical protein
MFLERPAKRSRTSSGSFSLDSRNTVRFPRGPRANQIPLYPSFARLGVLAMRPGNDRQLFAFAVLTKSGLQFIARYVRCDAQLSAAQLPSHKCVSWRRLGFQSCTMSSNPPRSAIQSEVQRNSPILLRKSRESPQFRDSQMRTGPEKAACDMQQRSFAAFSPEARNAVRFLR